MEAIRDHSSTPSTPVATPSPPSTPSAASASKPSFSPQPFRARPTSSSRQPSLHRPVVPPLDPTESEITITSTPASPRAPGDVVQKSEAGGTILGIHNLSIVAPQFFVALVAALIFRILEAAREGARIPGAPDEGGLGGSNDVVWVLRFGGIAAAGAAVMSRWVGKTRSEREYARVAMRYTGEEPELVAAIEEVVVSGGGGFGH